MLESMTGFGKAIATCGDKKIVVEIKSLNSRQFDLNIKLPSLYREKELELRKLLSERLERGKVEALIYTEQAEGQSEKRVRLNRELALAYLNDVRELAEAGGLELSENALPSILELPEVWQQERPELEEEEFHKLQEAVEQAADALLGFRRKEGAILADDIASRIAAIEALRLSVEDHLPQRLKTVRERIEKNIADVLQNEEVDHNRMEQEIIYYLEKLDITEEHTRLSSHCAYFRETMNSGKASGKKLGFITQEMGREINTMGSKANHVDIQKLVVQMKDELEKIKEQLLNIN